MFEQVNVNWIVHDTMTHDNWNKNKMKGGQFGISADGDQDTILVGSPKHLNRKGAVFAGDVEDDDQFGHSISLYYQATIQHSKSGAAILIDTSFLNLSFVNSPFTLAESDTLGVEIRQGSSDNKFQIVSITTIDRSKC